MIGNDDAPVWGHDLPQDDVATFLAIPFVPDSGQRHRHGLA